MPITVTEQSKEFVKSLFIKKFESIDLDMDYIYNDVPKLINAAQEYGLDDVVQTINAELKELA